MPLSRRCCADSVRPTFRWRRTALSAACLLALSAGARAQTGAYDVNYATGATATTQGLYLGGYTLSLTENQSGAKATSALVSGGGVASTLAASGGAAWPVTLSGTTFGTLGTANQSTAFVDLGLLSGAGLGILVGQSLSGTSSTSTGGVATTSRIENSALQVSQTGLAAAPIAIVDNTMSATATLNRSVTLVSGEPPITFPSSAQGSVVLKQSATTQESGNPVTPSGGTTASVNLGTFQSTFNAGARAGSKASMDNVDVALTLSGTSDGAGTALLDAPLTLGANRIGAEYTGNSASTVFGPVQWSGAFTGSVAVTSAQSNVETLSAGATNLASQVTGSTITADLRQQAAGTRTDLNAALTMSGNSITAAATGNLAGLRAASGEVLPGNATLIDGSATIKGTGSATNVSLSTHYDAATGSGAGAYADIAVVNAQYNRGTPIRTETSGAVVSARADNLGIDGSVTLAANALGASAAGNVAGSVVSLSVASLSGSVAAASVQNGVDTPVVATNTGGAVGAGIGIAGATSAGRVALDGSTITADAQGNRASTGVTLAAVDFVSVASEGAAASATAGTNTSASTVTSGKAGVMVANAQRLDYASSNGPVSATVSGGTVSANFTESGLSAGLRTGLSAANVSATENRVEARTSGNAASSSAELSATVASLQASLVNTQHVETGGTGLAASVSSGGVGITAGSVGASSMLSLDRNVVSATATANDVTSTLDGAFTNLSIAANPLSAGTATVTGTAATANAALNLASRQHQTAGAISASNLATDGFATVRGGSTGIGGIDASALLVVGNGASASVASNQATNTVRVAAETIDANGAGAQQVAALSNFQSIVSSSAATATVGASSAPAQPLVGIQFQESVAASALDVSGNAVLASAAGNRAGSALTVSGGTLGSGPPPAAGGSVSAGVTSDAVSNTFALASLQTDAAALSATARNAVVGIDAAGTLASSGVDDSRLAVTGNTVRADTRGNESVNVLSLTEFAALSGGAGIASSQSASGVNTASITGTVLRIGLSGSTAVTGSDLSLTDNLVQAGAVGSAASNRLLVEATTLAGNTAPSGTTATAQATSATVVNAVVNADFGVGSSQTQRGAVTAAISGSGLVSMSGATSTDGGVTIDGNAARASAQANISDNALQLSGGGIGGVGAGIANAQYADRAVTATQTSAESGASFAVQAASTEDTVSTVNGNQVVASAAVNEVLNALSVSGSTVEGRTGTGFAIANAQTGATGASVTATSRPGLLGLSTAGVNGGAATISANAVSASSSLNRAINALTLDAESSLSGNGLIQNSQSSVGAASATLGDTSGAAMTVVGVSAPVAGQGLALNGTNVNVSGNSLNAQAAGNTVSNALNATAPASIGAGTAPNFSALNTQRSTGTVTAQLAYANIGAYGAGASGSASDASMAVHSNRANATAYANTASSTIATSVPPGSATGVTMALGSSQSSTGAVTATATSVNFGAMASGATGGGSVVMSGNGTIAQASGNVSVNRVLGR